MDQGTVTLDSIRLDNDHESGGVHVGEFLQQLEHKRKNNAALVPTDDDQVQAMLRQLDQPVTLFGEDRGDRRDRLVKYIVDEQIDVQNLLGDGDVDVVDEDAAEDNEEFYTPISEELLEVRKIIARDSLQRSRRRLQTLKDLSLQSMTKQLTTRRAKNTQLQTYELSGSQMTSTRPTSTVTINKSNTSQILSGAWSGEIKLLDSQTLEIKQEFDAGNQVKIGGLDWSPTHQDIFASAGDSLHIWSTDSQQPLSELSGHTHRVTGCKFHPLGQYIASSSYDETWRLWDITTLQELQLQEGHSKGVHTVSFHPDGALVASGGLDAIAHVWDLRLGKSIFMLNGHIKPIHGLDWRQNGYHLATGAADGQIKIWDLRQTKELAMIPAHNKAVTECKFGDDVLVSSSMDGTVKLFSCDNWTSLKSLEGHSGQVMSVDICDEYVVSAGWDRSVKLWQPEKQLLDQ